ncbi:MAG: TIGR01777 family protein [Bdellovibrionales bacterium RBG_16_40_8]|nr:MAG: TIGR01777 family protein [Bdellovibrionales bacterium RBG_16_40_8]
MKIIVTGGTGFLGSRLIEALLKNNHNVVLITRQSPAQLGPSPCRAIRWPLQSKLEEEVLKDCEVVINLAGESIANGRWSSARKLGIRRSRIQLTNEIVDIMRSSTKLHTFISASAIGFYGHRKSELLTESSHAGYGFLANVCRDWESAALSLKRENLRTILLRTGIVLGRGGGFLEKIEPIYKMWAGGPIGAGDQFMSWIHINDWVRAVIFCLDNKNIVGPVNLVATEPVTNRSFSSLYAKLFRQPLQITTPKFAIKLALGEMAALALDSQNVRPEKLHQHGFKFNFPYLREALEDIYDYAEQKYRVHEFYSASVWVPEIIDKVFTFFAAVENLERMSPPQMNFRVVSKSTTQMAKGTLVDYKLKTHGVSLKWRSRIMRWEPPHLFSDTQDIGPFKYWHHTHEFITQGRGTLIKDKLHYRLPLRVFGRLGLPLIKKDIKNIFNYRKRVLQKMFITSEDTKNYGETKIPLSSVSGKNPPACIDQRSE